MLNVQKIYIAHYIPLKDRKINLFNQLKNYNLSAIWIEDEPKPEEIKSLYSSDKWNKKFHEMNNLNYSLKRDLKKSELSLCYKHLKIYEDIVKNDIKTALVLEDDVILERNFCNVFNLNLSLTPKNWDFIFIGNGCNLRIPTSQLIQNNIAYRKEHPASKCTDSYIIKLNSAKKILQTIIPFTFPIDFELNYQMFKHNMNVYWWEPPIVYQGSQCGLYRSEIQ